MDVKQIILQLAAVGQQRFESALKMAEGDLSRFPDDEAIAKSYRSASIKFALFCDEIRTLFPSHCNLFRSHSFNSLCCGGL